jgi:hypothetical protein
MTVENFYTTVVLSLLSSLKSKNVVNQLVAICARKKEWDPDSSSSSRGRTGHACMRTSDNADDYLRSRSIDSSVMFLGFD